MWEHAYYLQYENRKTEWVDAYWNLVNWPDVVGRFEKARRSTWPSAFRRPAPRSGPGCQECALIQTALRRRDYDHASKVRGALHLQRNL
jgi:hypothetical protein